MHSPRSRRQMGDDRCERSVPSILVQVEQSPHLPADGRSGLIHPVCPKNHHFTGSHLLIVDSKTEGAQSHGRLHRLPDAL